MHHLQGEFQGSDCDEVSVAFVDLVCHDNENLVLPGANTTSAKDVR